MGVEPKPALAFIGVFGTALAKYLTQENAAIFAGFMTGLFMLAQTVRLVASSFRSSTVTKTNQQNEND